MNFCDFSLVPELIKTLSHIGFNTPTPIQLQTIQPALDGKDILGVAQTGTGKTGAFLLPLLSLMSGGRARARMPRCVILEPTRELASQVQDACQQFCADLKLETALLIGGVASKPQEDKINRGVDILIATPGRFLDHFERGKLLLSDIQHLVIDEADRMLDMGFIPDIEKICEITPFTKQTMLFSATMPEDISKIAEKFMSSPVRVEVSKQSTTGENIAQHKIFVADKQKRELLRTILKHDNHSSDNTIVFCNSKRDVDILSNSLLRHGFSVAPLHGDIAQSIRTTVLDQFKAQNLKILVASDVAARGLDVPHIARVINFDIPLHAEDYVHRIGRTGRGGRMGESFSFVDPQSDKDTKRLRAIEKLISITIPETSFSDLGFAQSENTASKKHSDDIIPLKKTAKKPQTVSKNTLETPSKPYHKSNHKSDHADVLALKNDPQSFNDCEEIPAFLLTPLPKFAQRA